MTLALWILPAAILAVGLVPMLNALRALDDEAAALRAELRRAGAMRPALAEVRTDAQRLRAQLRRRA